MIIKAPIDLELTQNSGQTSQPPWKFMFFRHNAFFSRLGENSPLFLKNAQCRHLLFLDGRGFFSAGPLPEVHDASPESQPLPRAVDSDRSSSPRRLHSAASGI